MKPKDIKFSYRRNLPHIQPIGGTFFVTFRLKGSVSKAELTRLRQRYQNTMSTSTNDNNPADPTHEERNNRHFRTYDDVLDKTTSGPTYLRRPEVASVVAEQLHRFDGDLYELICYCIMSNHVHILIDTGIQIPSNYEDRQFQEYDFTPLSDIMKRIKGPSAVHANRLLGRNGKFWQRESYDQIVRNEKSLTNIMNYILQNPVKAGIVKRWDKFPYSYLSPRFR